MACIVYQTNKKTGYMYAYHAVAVVPFDPNEYSRMITERLKETVTDYAAAPVSRFDPNEYSRMITERLRETANVKEVVEDDDDDDVGACSEVDDFFRMTDRLEGSLDEYNDGNVMRFIESVTIHPDKISVKFKAGIEITI